MYCHPRGNTGWLTVWLRAICLSAFACELQITARQHQACSRQRQGFTLSSAPRSCLWVLCHMTLTEIDPLPTSRSCCATQCVLWCCNHHLKDKKRNSPLSMCNWVTMTWSLEFSNFVCCISKSYVSVRLMRLPFLSHETRPKSMNIRFTIILPRHVKEFSHSQYSLASRVNLPVK